MANNSFDLYQNINGIPTTPVAPEGGQPVPSGNGNAPTKPVAPEGGLPVFPGNENIPSSPSAPGGGMPSAPGIGGIPTTPVAPVPPSPPGMSGIPTTPVAPVPPTFPGIGGIPTTPVAPVPPSFPGIGGIPTTPVAPVPPPYPGIGSTPSTPGYPGGILFPNWVPSIPMRPSGQCCAQIRFLNALTVSYPVNIYVDNNVFAINSRFGTVTNYDRVVDGFHTITVRRVTGMRTILYQQTIPLSVGEKLTFVLVDSGSGMDLVRVQDTGCRTQSRNNGCYRIANMTYDGSAYDLMLYGGEVVFTNVRFKEVAPFKQAMAGEYQFYLTNTTRWGVVREIPVLVIGAVISPNMNQNPLVSFNVNIEPGKLYTSYIIGANWSSSGLRVMTIES